MTSFQYEKKLENFEFVGAHQLNSVVSCLHLKFFVRDLEVFHHVYRRRYQFFVRDQLRTDRLKMIHNHRHYDDDDDAEHQPCQTEQRPTKPK